MTIKIVVDTSIFVSAIIGKKGPSRELIRRCLKKEYLPLMGNTLFCEYESLITRSNILEQCPLNPLEIRTLLASFLGVCQWINIYYLWRPNLKDEGDNHLIELALAGNAQFLVTNNLKDFAKSQLLFPHLSIVKSDDLIRS